MLVDKEELDLKFSKYVDKYFSLIKNKYGNIENEIFTKRKHSFDMALRGYDVTTKQKEIFNESYALSSYIEGLLHDIGRFLQYYLMGSLNDVELNNKMGFRDHGDFGRYILKENNQALLRYLIPNASNYDFVLKEIIGEHTTIVNSDYKFPFLDLKNIFSNYDFKDVLNSKDQNLKNKLIAIKLLILQENDALELLRNVVEKNFTPGVYMVPEEMCVENGVWDDFLNFRRINLAKYKKQGDWRINFGVAFRYGLLTQVVNFVNTLKSFVEQNSFEKIWEETTSYCFDSKGKDKKVTELTDPLIKDAHLYAQIAVDNLIKTSPDGVFITPESREKARVLSLKMWEEKGHHVNK